MKALQTLKQNSKINGLSYVMLYKECMIFYTYREHLHYQMQSSYMYRMYNNLYTHRKLILVLPDSLLYHKHGNIFSEECMHLISLQIVFTPILYSNIASDIK